MAMVTSPFFHEQRASRDLSRAGLVTVCGCGAIGANLAETLARMGLPRLRLIDCDRVEVRNLSTQPWLRANVGQPKARVLAAHLYRAVGCRAEAVTDRLTAENAERLLRGSALVIDTFDNSVSRRAVQDAVRRLALPCLHIGFSGDGYGEAVWDEEYVVPDDSHVADPCDYAFTRPLMHLLVGVGAELAVRFLLEGCRNESQAVLINDLIVCSRKKGRVSNPPVR